MSSPYATDVPPSTLRMEQAINAAVYIGAVAWGIHVSVFLQSCSALWQSAKSNRRWLPFLFSMLALASVNICCSIRFNELAWIDERNYPGGPLAFIVQQSSRPVNTVSIATSVVSLFLADGFLVRAYCSDVAAQLTRHCVKVYRCHALWNKIWVTVALSCVLAASTVLSVMHCIQAARPDAGLWDDATVKISLPYASVSMSLNILFTVILGWRLLDLRRKLPAATSDDRVKRFGSMRAIAVETALPYGLASFLFVVLYGLRNTGANLFVPLLVQLEFLL
ncbi:hypothetical protein OH77DRAFT_23803 [Trametes cingulata]|nr:hypothetical protein OH77DRAFT_23803 [Trametes cingulata]